MAEFKRIFTPYYFPHDPNMWETVEGFFTKEECDLIKTTGKNMGLQKAGINKDNYDNPLHRKAEVSWIPHSELDWMWVKLHNEIVRINHQNWGFNLKHFDEAAQYTVYDGKGTHFDFHMDNGPAQLSVRKISICVNLNEPSEWEGGELQFYKDRNVIQSLGAIHVFPSYMLHRITPLTGGKRESLVLWSGGEFYK